MFPSLARPFINLAYLKFSIPILLFKSMKIFQMLQLLFG